MLKAFIYLAPGLASQTLTAGLLLLLFVNTKDKVGPLRIAAVAAGLTLLNLLIEWVLSDYLLAATLVLQYVVFAIIVHRALSMTLARTCITLFCFFSLMMGMEMLHVHLDGAELTEDEKLLVEGFERPDSNRDSTTSQETWVQRLEAGLLSQKTYASKNEIARLLYPTRIQDQPPLQVRDTARPFPAPTATPVPRSPVNPSSMSAAQFEALFYPPVSAENELPADPFDDPVLTPQPGILVSDLAPGLTSTSLNAEQMSSIVDIRNRSTDPSYSAPEFRVSAVSIGSQGRMAIVDGSMLRQGSVVPSPAEPPRAWRLYRIEQNELFWQPLK